MRKNIFLVLGALVAIIAAWMLLFPGKNPLKMLKKTPGPVKSPAPANPPAPEPNGSFTPAAPPANQPAGFPLYPDTHTYKREIAILQDALNRMFGSTLAVDGYFGPKTLTALKANGFAQDGYLTYQENYSITSGESL